MRRAGRIEAVGLNVTDHADYGDVFGASLPARSARIRGCEHDRPSPGQLDMLPDRIAVFPIFALERFVDHRDSLTRRVVVLREHSSLAKRRLQDIEVS